MGKFCQIITQLRPLIFVQTCILLNIFLINRWILIKFWALVYIDKIWTFERFLLIFLFIVNFELSYCP